MPSWKELKRFCDRDGWELYTITNRRGLWHGTIVSDHGGSKETFV